MAVSSILQFEQSENGILRLTLDHEARRNALSEAMMADLTSAITKAGYDSTIRVIILAA
ncbi:MAG: enoyl-CoA hydratase-related protein, partial [Candidatus Puniceispirillales bacterium]